MPKPKPNASGRRTGEIPISTLTLSIKIAQKPYIIGSLGPKALKYESFEGKGKVIGGWSLGFGPCWVKRSMFRIYERQLRTWVEGFSPFALRHRTKRRSRAVHSW